MFLTTARSSFRIVCFRHSWYNIPRFNARSGDALNLPERLLQIAKYVPQSSQAADIGTDHALLPVYLVQQGICSKVIAGDINDGPLAAARANVALFNLWEQVELRQGDGLESIRPGEVEVIVIAGMGGVKITEILNSGRTVLQQARRLILQPAAGAVLVRRWLTGNGWDLTDEDLVLDDGRFYEIIVAEPVDKEEGQKENSDLLMEIGPKLLEKRHPLLAACLDKQVQDMKNVLIALRRAQTPVGEQRRQEWAGKIAYFQAVIKRLRSDLEDPSRFLQEPE
jgi:tRNA (adenine22-N1)-methyltransferase